jgi:peptidoglycan/LPS O-acetylase OafA/YrhL
LGEAAVEELISGSFAFPAMPAPPRVPTLDPLRGLAVLMVFVFHYMGAIYSFDHYEWNGNWRSFHPTASTMTNVLCYPLTLGWSGVSLFFVLSGFVIHWRMAAKPVDAPFDVKSFAQRRFWRIVPPYLVAIAFIVILQKSYRETTEGRWDVLAHVLFVHNFHERTFLSLNASFWSLAVEMQFYLLYPLVLWGRRSFGLGKVLGFAAVLMIAARIILSFVHPCDYPIDVFWTSLPVLWFDWLLGAFVAERCCQGRTTFGRRPFLLTSAFIVLTIMASLYKPTNGWTFTLASLASISLIDGLVHHSPTIPGLGFIGSGLSRLGIVSYSFYLLHQTYIEPILRRLKSIGFPHPGSNTFGLIVNGFAVFALLVAASTVFYFAIERPSITRAWRSSNRPRAA